MKIYKITNEVNGKIYIGQTTKSLQQRFSKHFQEAKCEAKGNRPNNYFHNALLKYGQENFRIELLDTANSLNELNKKEKDWIEKLDARNKKIGYNLQEGGVSGKKPDSTKEKIRRKKLENWQNPELAKRMKKGLKKATEEWQKIAEEQRIELTCPICKKRFKVPQYVVDNGRKYCSKKCAAIINAPKASQQAAIVNSAKAKEKHELFKKDINNWAKENKQLILSCPLNKISTNLIEIQEIGIKKYGISDWRTISQAIADTKSRKEMLVYLKDFCENVC